VLNPVVAPQLRLKTTALIFPEGDIMLRDTSFAHNSSSVKISEGASPQATTPVKKSKMVSQATNFGIFFTNKLDNRGRIQFIKWPSAIGRIPPQPNVRYQPPL
jgi:hypothetical protein